MVWGFVKVRGGGGGAGGEDFPKIEKLGGRNFARKGDNSEKGGLK